MEEAGSCVFNSTVFQQDEQNGTVYRIPALLYIPTKHTFLAFAEKRSTSRDQDALHLVLRRGLMAGCSVQWGPLVPLLEATLPGHRTMNPCPVWEQKTGCVYLFFICVRGRVTERRQILSGRNAARLCCICSRDAGCSWSGAKDLTEEVVAPQLEHWATFAVGPGHGIQLRSGRLVVPAYTYCFSRWFLCAPLPCTVKPHSLMIYSDDLGVTWRCGRLVRPLVTVECQAAEVSGPAGDPVLYCSARTPSRCRAEAFSTDRGECFQTQVLNPRLCEPPHGCQGSVLSFQPSEVHRRAPGPSGEKAPTTPKSPVPGGSPELQAGAAAAGGPWLLYSHPTGKRRRTDLGIYCNQSPLDGACWSRPWILYRGPCGYSDLAVVEDQGLFACLFECGIKQESEQIAFCLFSGQEVLSYVQEERASPSRDPS